MESNNIDVIVNVSPFISTNIHNGVKIYDFSEDVKIVKDNDEDGLERIINIVVSKLNEFKNENILLYSDTGANLGAAIICKYFMSYFSFEKSIGLVRAANNKRSICTINNDTLVKILKK
jgi:hypothetical protein